ncbi:MAG: VWA domain-containing protein [Clostridia bacterium]
MNKKIICSFILFIMLSLICVESFATTVNSSDSTIELFNEKTCEINLNDMGKLTKELTNFDKNKKEATITLTVTNSTKEQTYVKPLEVFLILDSSNSMTKTYENQTKIQHVAQTASSFIEALFSHFTNFKVGLISFSSIDPLTDTSSTLGTEDDAKLLLPLSNSKDAIENAINTYTQSKGPYTNIEAGLSIAESNFTDSTDSEKHIILISDGVPNVSLDTENTLAYSGINAQNTKNRLLKLQSKGFKISSVLMRVNESSVVNPGAPMVEGENRRMTYGELVEEIFGTVTNPTAGNFYYINYNNLATTLTENIYNTIVASMDNTIKNIVIKDYFPQEIIDNFNFEYVKSPNIGEVSQQIDKSDNSITWNIELLKENSTGTLSYKLSLKDKYDKEIANKLIPLNTKLDIEYETVSEKFNNSSEDFPQIKLTYKEPDNTIAEEEIPQTGNYSSMFLIIAVICITAFIITRIRLINKY